MVSRTFQINFPSQSGSGDDVLDVTYEPALESANNLKQIGLATIHYDGSHSGGIQWVMGDGSVRLVDASDSFVFDGNSQPIGEPVTFTATVSNLAGLDEVFVASGDVDGAQPVTHAGWGPWELSHPSDLIV